MCCLPAARSKAAASSPDWPGLKPAQLYEARDLAPTSDVRAVLKGLLADQFGLSAALLGDKVFPDSAAVKPMRDLTT